jgi:hypothetical protein
MYKFLYKIHDGQRVPCLPSAAPLLSSPDDASSAEERRLIVEVNKTVDKQLSVACRGNGGKYNKLDDETRMKIAKKCSEIGASKTARHFKDKGLNLNESTVRSIMKSYVRAKKSQKTDDPKFVKNRRGRKLLLGELDDQILSYVKKLRLAGGVVNRTLLIAIARGFIQNSDTCKVPPERIGLQWAKSFLNRHHYVKRKGTKAARKIPEDFPLIKQAFTDKVHKLIEENNIPDELVINFDQTGCKIVPTSDWTLEREGS